MEYTIENEYLRIRIDEIGAELKGLYSKVYSNEYMWQPGYEIWDHSSLILFPNPARISRDRVIINGKVYPATMHGFAYKSRFDFVSQDDTSLVLELRANEQTRRTFPYDFRLRVSFILENDVLIQKFQVWNTDGSKMFFSLGAHPGFYLPIIIGESGEDYALCFDCKQNAERLETQWGTMLLTGKSFPYLTNQSEIALHENFFDSGSVILSKINANYITLTSKKSNHYVKIGISGFPYLCLWGNPYKNALICIEPWCGVSDMADTDHVWETKLGIENVEPGKKFERELTFQLG